MNKDKRDEKEIIKWRDVMPEEQGRRHTAIITDDLIEQPTNNKPTIMSKVINHIKRLGLKENDKALLDTGMEEPSGEPTSEGYDTMERILWSEYRDKVAEYAKEVIKEDKKK